MAKKKSTSKKESKAKSSEVEVTKEVKLTKFAKYIEGKGKVVVEATDVQAAEKQFNILLKK